MNDINRLHAEKNKNDWKDINKRLDDYKKRWGQNQRYRELHKRSMLARLDVEDNTSRRNDILDELNKAYLGIKVDYPEPPKPTVKAVQETVVEKKEEANQITETIKAFTDVPFAFNEAISEKKFNKEWEEYLSKNNHALAPEYVGAYGDDNKLESIDSQEQKYIFEIAPKVLSKCFAKSKYSSVDYFYNSMTSSQMTEIWDDSKELRQNSYFAAALLKKRFHRQVDKINNSKNPEKIAKNYLKIYKGFKSDFDGWFKSFNESILNMVKAALLYQYVLFMLKAQKRDDDYIYDLLNLMNVYVPAENYGTYFGITNYEMEHTIADIAWDYAYTYLKNNKWGHSDITKYWKGYQGTKTFVEVKTQLGDQEDAKVRKILKEDSSINSVDPDEVILQPTIDNKPFFGPNEAVSIRMKLKNINQLTIKVFQIDTIKYYSQNKKEIESDINLDGLVANSEKIIDYSAKCKSKLIVDDILLEIPKDNRGVFIVDFIGNVKSCRIIIRKGSLKYITKDSDEGTLIYILDENDNLCISDRTGVIIGKDYYKSDPTSGKILISYRSLLDDTAILIHQGYAQFTKDAQLYQDTHKLKSDFIVSWESLIVGNKSVIAVKVNLSKNGTNIKINETHNLRFVLTVKHEEGETYSQNYENVTLSEHGTFDMEFKVSSSITSITVTSYCSVFSKSLNKEIQLESSSFKSIPTANTNSPVSLYLKDTAEGYCLYCVGKNGEPKKFIKVQVNASHQFLKANSSVPYNCQAALQSDEKGIIKLGNLKNVSRLYCTVTPRRNGDMQSFNWNLDYSSRAAMNNILVYENNMIKIPCELYGEKSLSTRSASLVEVSQTGNVIENHSKKLEFEAFEGHPYEGTLNVKLTKGVYKLYLKKWNLVYNLRVISTKQIKILDEDIVIQGSKILQNFRSLNGLQIQKYSYDQANTTFKFNLRQYSSKVKIYAIAKHFMDDEIQSHNAKVFNCLDFPSQITYTLPKQVNLYLYGRKLHEEYNYVIERKNAKKYIGNSLEKPTLILKRMFIRDTKTGEQKAKEGTDFKKMDISKAAEISRRSKEEKQVSSYEKAPYYEFLNLPAKIYTDLKHQDGYVEIKDPELANYSYLYFIIFDDEVVINKTIPLKENQHKIPVKDLCLKKAFDEKSGYLKRKEFDVIKKDKTFEIEDVYNCEYQLFDSLDRVFVHLRENCSSNKEEFKKWEFLLKWNKLTFDEKNKYYDEFASNELNLFIFFKDQEYFENVLNPYLQNKLSKNLFDKFLLNEPTKDLFSFERLTRSNLIELFLIALLDGSNKTLRMRILQKINSLLKEDFDENGLKTVQNFFIDGNRRAQQIPADAQVEKEFYYDSNWNTLTPSVIWAYLLSNICKDPNLNRENLAKSKIPLPKFMPKGLGILESILVLSVIDLPFGSGKTKVESNKKMGLIIKPSSDVLIYRDFFKQSEFQITNTTLVRCKMTSKFKLTNKNYVEENDVFWTDAIYTSEVIVTNLTAVEQTYKILFQIPEGSISISGNKTMKYMPITLSAFQTKNVTLPSFYFPQAGIFTHAPVFVYLDNEVVAVSNKRSYTVLAEGTIKVDPNEIIKKPYQLKDKIGQAKKTEILDILKTEPILAKGSEFSYSQIYHMLKDANFYKEAIKILKKRKLYDEVIYSSSIMHRDYDTLSLYFDAIKTRFDLGYSFNGTIVKVEPKEKGFRYLDYYPLINQRVHALGKSKKILNNQFKEQYTLFLKICCMKTKLDNAETMWLIYYFLLQDKIDQALACYNKYKNQISDDNRVQFDYLRCYMDFYLGEPKYETALQISEKYLDYPVINWKKLFESVNYKVKKALNLGSQLNARENLLEKNDVNIEDIVIDEQNKMLRAQKFEQNILKGEKSLDVVVKDQEIRINCTTLKKIEVFYYPIDYEILISNDPFSQMAFDKCTFIITENKETHDVTGKTSLNIPIPKKYLHLTLFIQVKGDDYLQKEAVFYESNLTVYVNKEEKLLQVLDNKEKPLPLCYVKIFYKAKNQNAFSFRDGYTDFRGMHRYLNKQETAESYDSMKVFAYHEEYGIKVLDI